MKHPRVAILGGVRTPFTKAGGALASIAADDLGALAVREALARTGVDADEVDEAVVGNVGQPAHAANVGRVIALKAGLPARSIGMTVHHNCASGLRAVTDAAGRLARGDARLVVAAGTESMSGIPLLVSAAMTKVFIRLVRAKRLGQRVQVLASIRPSFLKPIIALELGLTDPVCGLNMGQTAEVLAREFGVTRAEQDAFALESHRRAAAARRDGRFADEIAPIVVPPSWSRVAEADDGIRDDQTIEALAKLRPYFDRDAGTVTVGNACPITDGAVALVMCGEAQAKALGVTPLGYVSGWSYAGLDGRRMGLGPAYATARLLDAHGWSLSDFDLVELNEAFAAQVIANERAFASDAFARAHLGRDRALGAIDPATLNVNGGAIALGHPVGATGARLVLTVLHELRRRGGGRGLATLCVSGGQGAAIALEAA